MIIWILKNWDLNRGIYVWIFYIWLCIGETIRNFHWQQYLHWSIEIRMGLNLRDDYNDFVFPKCSAMNVNCENSATMQHGQIIS